MTIPTRSNIGETRPLKSGYSISNAFDAHSMELELAPDFKELLKLFNKNNVKYLLIGGYAVSIHGYVRATNDIDFAVASHAENARNIVAALTEFGFGSSGISVELFTRDRNVVRMGVPPVKIEILNYLEGPGFDAAYERRKTVEVENISINVIGLDDLCANKSAVGRPQDLVDVDKLKERNK